VTREKGYLLADDITKNFPGVVKAWKRAKSEGWLKEISCPGVARVVHGFEKAWCHGQFVDQKTTPAELKDVGMESSTPLKTVPQGLPVTKHTEFLPERRAYVNAVINNVFDRKITMVSRERMENVRDSAIAVIEKGLEGDFVETGTWQGGCSIVMRAVNNALGDKTRRANWLFDTFEGLPGFDDRDTKIEQAIAQSQKMDPEGSYKFSGGLDTVKRHFISILGDDFKNLKFQKGFFKDTVPVAEVDKIAVLRLDGDMYSSTMDVLKVFYDKVVSGGYVIIDDYGHWPQCKKAIHDFFDTGRGMDIGKLLRKVDYTGYYFIKP